MRKILIATWLAAVLVGCGKQEAPAPQASSEVVATQAPAQGFALLEAGSKSENDRPSLSLRFNRALANTQDFNKLIEVRDDQGNVVDGGWRLWDDNRGLRFDDVMPERKYQLTLSAELLDEAGTGLGKASKIAIDSVELPAAVGFASQGSVLPSRGSLGLPVVSVNTPEIDVEFFRVRSADLAVAIRNLRLSGRTWNYDLESLTRYADSVYVNRFALDASPNQRRISYLPIHELGELSSPGLYYAVMKRVASFDSGYEVTHYVVSDIGLHVRNYRQNSEIVTRSLLTGAPLSGVQVRVLDRFGAPLLESSTDGEGFSQLAWTPESDQLLLAERGGDLSLLAMSQPALDLSEYELSGGTSDASTVFIYSGRDLYRPGETLRFSALLRDFDGKLMQAGKLYATIKQPDGRAYAQMELDAEALGYYRVSRKLGLDAPIGKWALEIATDPGAKARQHRFNFRVEEFLPERMKLALDSPIERLNPGDALPFSVDSAYLYGAPAAGNRFTAKLILSPAENLIAELKGYVYGDLVNVPKPDPKDIIDQTLDAEGKLQSTVPIELENIQAPLTATLIGSVFETGARPVTRTLARSIWPASELVALRPLFDPKEVEYGAKVGFEALRVNASGERIAGEMEVRVIALDREYNWSYSADLGWRADYSEKPREISREKLNFDGNKPLTFSAQTEWGPYIVEIVDSKTGLVTRYPFESGTGWQQNRGLDPRPDKVKLALDKASYRSGDTLTVTVTPPAEGEGLLLVESDRVLHRENFNAKRGSRISLTVGPDWERHDIYLTALVFKPGSAQESATPTRSLGIIHVPIDRKDRAVEVSMELPNAMEPQSTLSTMIKAPKLAGQEAFVTVNAVDIGVTNITNFEVPDPFAGFFSPRAYMIDSYDLYGRIIEALVGDQARLRFGGDGALKALLSASRPDVRVQIVDLFAQPIKLDAKGEAKVDLEIPDFNGTLRVSSIVFGQEQFGKTSSEVLVRAPVVAEVGMPRALTAGDEAQLALDVQNFTGKASEFVANFSGDDLVKVMPASMRITLKEGEKQSLRFTLLGQGGQGVGKIKLKLTGAPRELNRSFELAVRSIAPHTRTVRLESFTGPTTINLKPEYLNWIDGTVRSRVVLSSRLPLPVQAAASETLDYPYGCIEQTSTKLFPLLLLDASAQANLGLSAISAKKRDEQARFGIDRIASMQLASGHFSYWPGTDYSDASLTPYVTDILLDAKDAGFALPPELLQRSLERIKNDVLQGADLEWSRHDGETMEHARFASLARGGYVLARVNQAPLGTLRSVFDNDVGKVRSGLPLMYLAVALKRAGDENRAKQAAAMALGDYWVRKREWLSDYGSTRSDQARMLALALEHQFEIPDRDDKIAAVTREFANGYRSTFENGSILYLARALVKQPSSPITGSLNIGAISEGFDSRTVFGRDLHELDLRAGASLQIASAGPIYLSQETVGAPATFSDQSSDGLKIERKYFRLDGSAYGGEALTEGEMLIVQLKTNTYGQGPDVLLTDLLPGGLEIENIKLMDSTQMENLQIEGQSLKELSDVGSVQYEEYRDDRFVAALGQQYSDIKLHYLVRAVTPGSYRNPPSLLEDMYRADRRTVKSAEPAVVVVKRKDG